jgi:hypothetical protein
MCLFRFRSFIAFSICVFTSSIVCGQQPELTDGPLMSAAGEDSLLFSAWMGLIDYDSAGGNATERLMSEPELKAFGRDLLRRAGLMIPALDPGDEPERQELLHQLGPRLANAVLTRPGCIFLESVEFNQFGEPVAPRGAMLLDAGDDANDLFMMLSQAVTGEQGGGTRIGGHDFVSISLDNDMPMELWIGHVDRLIMIALGERTVTQTIARMQAGKVPAFVTDFRSAAGIKQLNSLTYVNVRDLRRQAIKLGGNDVVNAFSLMGLSNAESIETCNGLGADQWRSRLLVRLDGRPEGLLDLSGPDGLSADDLRSVPADSLFAAGLSLDPSRAMRMLQMAVTVMSNGRDNLSQMFDQFRRETGVDLQQDLIAHLGSSWVLCNGAGDGWFSGLTLTANLKDAQAFGESVETLIKTAMIESRDQYSGPEFIRYQYQQHSITSVRVRQFPFPIEPSWCVTDDRLIVALYPQAIETALQEIDTRLLSDDNGHDQFLRTSFVDQSGDTKLLAMGYVDAATNFEISYPYLQMMSSMSRGMIDEFTYDWPPQIRQRVGAVLSGIRLPRARVIHQHLQPSLLAMRQTDVGIEVETTQTIPSLDVGQALPVGVAVLLPAIQATRGAARRTVSANNLRQQVLAAHNYESAHRRFPAGYTQDQQGNRLLSWRVQILPFIEQGHLYEQFHLDEPWDSPHNQQLLKQMPDVFRSPMSSAGEGMTVYRGIGGKAGVLQGSADNRGTTFGQITDGTSGTIFLIETTDELAVPWTKPDEGLDPDNFERDAVFGLYPGGTNIARCDGSVNFLADTTSPDKLRAMMMMNDGLPVSWGENEYSPRRRRRLDREESPVDPRFKLDRGGQVLQLDGLLNEQDRAKLAKRERIDQIRNVGLAMHNFESTFRGFPRAYSVDRNGKPLLSWRVHILPFIEQDKLYQQFRLDEPWDSEHNRALIDQMPEIYVFDPATPAGKTSLVGVGGKSGMINTLNNPRRPGTPVGTGFGSIIDGSSNTIMLIDIGAENAVEWTRPTEFEPTPAMLQKILAQEEILMVLGDGSVQRIRQGAISLETLKAGMTMNGGELVDFPN